MAKLSGKDKKSTPLINNKRGLKMRTRRMKALLRVAAVSTIAIGGLCLAGGCESKKTPAPQAYSNSQPPSPVSAAAAPTAATPGPVVSPAAPSVAPSVIVPASHKSNVKKPQHTVEKGDTLAKIAKKYHINKQDLADYNHMSLNSPLKAGSKINIPPAKTK